MTCWEGAGPDVHETAQYLSGWSSHVLGTLRGMTAPIDTRRLAVARAARRARAGDRVDHDVRPGTVVVALRDEDLLKTLTDLRWRLGGLLESGPSTLVLDVSQVRRLSSATIAVLLWVKRRCLTRGVQVVVRRPSRDSLAVLARTGLQSALDIERRGLRPVALAHPDEDGATGTRR